MTTRRVQRMGDPNAGGGVITCIPQTTVWVNNRRWAVQGSRGTGHGPAKHATFAWVTVPTVNNVFIENILVNRTADVDDCGHPRIIGSPDVWLGDGEGIDMGACSNITYVSPAGVRGTYGPAAQAQMGTEAPTPQQINPTPVPNPIMKDDSNPPTPPSTPPVSCDEFTETTPDSVQLSTNYNLAQLTYLCPGNQGSYHATAQCGLSRAQIICNLKQMAEKVAEPVRAYGLALGHTLTISSGFRLLGANPGSAHYRGAALDMQFLSMSPVEMFTFAQWTRDNLPSDQIIMEGYGASNHWVHNSLPLMGCVGVTTRLLTQVTQNTYQNGLALLDYSTGTVLRTS